MAPRGEQSDGSAPGSQEEEEEERGEEEDAFTTTDESDLDDVPLFLPSASKDAAGPPRVGGLPLSAPLPLKALLAPRSSAPAADELSPLPSSRGAVRQAHPAVLATPDPAAEPLPSSRSGRPVGQLRLAAVPPATSNGVPALPLRGRTAAGSSNGSTAEQHQHPSTQQETGGSAHTPVATLVQVSLLSPVFCLTEQQWSGSTAPQEGGGLPDSLAQQVTQRLAASLGVAPQQVRLFSARPLAAHQAAGSATTTTTTTTTVHVAAHVDNSCFSLTALEDMLAQNAKLQAAQQKSSETISTMYQDLRTLQADHSQLLIKSTQQGEQLKAQMDRNLALQEEVAALRAQLQASDEVRQRLQSAIKELRRNFQASLAMSVPILAPTS